LLCKINLSLHCKSASPRHEREG